jgi:glutamine synthetase
VTERLARAGVEAVGLAMVDNAGVTRVKCVPVERFGDAVRWGIGLSNVFSVFLANDDITSAPGLETPSGDTRLMPDPAACVPLAAMPGWAWAPVDQLDQEGNVWGACPRSFLKRMIERLAAHGLELLGAFEVEFFLGSRDEPTAVEPEGDPTPVARGPAYSASVVTRAGSFALDLMRALRAQGSGPLQFHAEYAIGQLEISIPHRDALGAADDNVVLRQTIRATAHAHGLAASFAPVVFPGVTGNGQHLHFSLRRRGRNLFADGDGPEGMTAEAAAFSAGILAELPALVAITCPSVPSYQRLRPHNWAGAFACWGRENREAALRFVTGMIGGRSRFANMEMKAMDGASNPYLALGAIVAAGLAGLERGLSLPEPTIEFPDAVPARQRKRHGIRPLPTSLEEATDELEGSAVIREAMGDPLFDSFVAVRRAEWKTFGGVDDEDVVRAHRWRY